jgi:hypothetical protein
MTTNERGGRSLLARIFSLEGAMAAFGLYSLGSGLQNDEPLWIFWGVMILVGLGVLMQVRRRDWKKHWEELEAEAAARALRNSPKPPENPRGEV